MPELKLKLPLAACDGIVIAVLKEDAKILKHEIKHSTNLQDKADNQAYLEAVKVVLRYYGAER